MSEVAENGAVQGNGLPSIETEDIKPREDQGSTSKDAPKAERQDESQPPKNDSGAKDKGPGPWSEKLAERGLNDPAFDEFIRSEIQPYITQLEQKGGGGGEIDQMFGGDVEQAEALLELAEALRSDPEGTITELMGILGMSDADEMGEEDFGPEMEDEGGYDDDPRLQYLDQMMQREQEQREDGELEQLLTELETSTPGLDRDLFVTCLIATEGDPDAAYQRYMKFHRQPAAPPESPGVLGNQGGTPPPSEPEFKSWHDAFDSYMSEERARKSRG